MVQLNNLIGPMVQNLASTDAALDRILKLSALPRNDPDRRLEQMHLQLESIANEQRRMLNVFSGTYASFTSNELLGASTRWRRR